MAGAEGPGAFLSQVQRYESKAIWQPVLEMPHRAKLEAVTHLQEVPPVACPPHRFLHRLPRTAGIPLGMFQLPGNCRRIHGILPRMRPPPERFSLRGRGSGGQRPLSCLRPVNRRRRILLPLRRSPRVEPALAVSDCYSGKRHCRTVASLLADRAEWPSGAKAMLRTCP